MCGNEHTKNPQRTNNQGRICTIVSFQLTTLAVTDIGIYAIEDLQVA